MNVRLNVTACFSVTLGLDETDSLDAHLDKGARLRKVVGQHVKRLVADGALPEAIDRIEIAEVATDSDKTIIRGTNG